MVNPIRWRRVLAGQASVLWWPVLGVLALLSVLYRWVVSYRNRFYDKRGLIVSLDVPVISVGNITTGGTGKTPVVIDFVKRLETLDRTVAVVARGYGAVADTPNDEEQLIRRHCPNVIYVADPDRAVGGALAIERHGANVIILDDGFQHRRLGRNLDVVLIDATCPFGFNYLLPRGLLRESLSGLTRADVIVITRCDQVTTPMLHALERKLMGIAPSVPRVRTIHRVVAITTLAGEDMNVDSANQQAVIFGGIGHPKAFESTVRSMGIEIVGQHWWPDHHNYKMAEVKALTRAGRFPANDFFLTTEKDAVKLCTLEGVEDIPIGIVKIAIDFMDDGDTIMQQLLEDVLRESY